jgi:crossover junction endodeoxyribonuclease RuvC
MIILGIDPGSAVTGFGLVQQKYPNKIIHIDNGNISTSKKASFPDRLLTIHQALVEVIEKHRPQEVALENIFYAKNVRSALMLGHVRGVVMLTAMQYELPLFEYAPTQVKQAVAGYGRADKRQVQRMVKVLLNLPQEAPSDASDALAVAICHNFSRRSIKR